MAERIESRSPAAGSGRRSRRLLVGDLEVDLESETVHRRGDRVELPILSFRLFAAIIRETPNGVRTDALAAATWGETADSDETIRRRVHLLRKALAAEGDETEYIGTDRGRGYRLLVAATPIQAPTDGVRAPGDPARRDSGGLRYPPQCCSLAS